MILKCYDMPLKARKFIASHKKPQLQLIYRANNMHPYSSIKSIKNLVSYEQKKYIC